MKRIISILLVVILSMSFSACSVQEETAMSETKIAVKTTENTTNQMSENMIYIKVNDSTLSVKLENNSSAVALKELLQNGDITINMSDYSHFEKVGDLGTSLPTNDENITTEAGDLILYQGNKITLYYDNNSWSFTKLGKVRYVSQDELKEILGNGDITATFTINK